jgi:hypothetical protein
MHRLKLKTRTKVLVSDPACRWAVHFICRLHRGLNKPHSFAEPEPNLLTEVGLDKEL